MSKRSRKTSPAKSPDQDHAGLTAWANIAVVNNKFQNPYWPNLLARCEVNGITSEANDWLRPIMGSMQDLWGKIVWQPTLMNYLRRVHGMPDGEALALPLNDLAGLLWQDAQQSGKGTAAPPAVWAEIEANLDAYMGDWKKSLLDHLEKQPPAQPPATGEGEQGEGAGKSRAEILQSLSERAQKAYLAYELVESTNGKRLEDREAYDYLHENGLPDNAGDLGELSDYELPAFDTWARYVRESRQALGEQKYNRRAGRQRGRSIATTDEVERRERDK